MAVGATSLRVWIWASALFVWSVLVFGAGRAVEGRRVVDELASPDGRLVAFVREEASLDPPRQSLWIGPAHGQAVQVARLAEDQDWSDEIFWSPDGVRVGRAADYGVRRRLTSAVVTHMMATREEES